MVNKRKVKIDTDKYPPPYRATPETVRAKFAERFQSLKEQERNTFKQRFVTFDFEVFPNQCHLTMLDIATAHCWSVWGADAIRNVLRKVFVFDQSVVLVGFNSKRYDNYIADAILAGAREKEVADVSRRLIESNDYGPWRSASNRRGRPQWVGRTFDIGFDIGQRKVERGNEIIRVPEVSLKRWARLNGLVVRRCPIPFDRPIIRKSDMDAVAEYCLDDNCVTATLLLSDESWNPCLNARRVLVDEYGDRGVDWEMTKPRITCIVLDARPDAHTVPTDWHTKRFKVPDNVCILKHRDVLEQYTTLTFEELRDRSSKLGGGGVIVRDVCGLPHVYGVGGVHGCGEEVVTLEGGGIYSVDAASLYPNIMRHYDLLSRGVTGDARRRFGELIDLRTKVYKPAGDQRAEGLKLVLNGGFGQMGFMKSEMFDPEHFHSVTILGQLLITDLLEKMERHINLIQSNTDGIIFTLRDNTPEGLDRCKRIVKAYERRTKLEMEWREFEVFHQRTISDYVAREMPKQGKPSGSGKIKTKGQWFGIKHCSVKPYLYESRIYAALNGGKTMSPYGIPLDRFAIEIKRDKNSEAFLIDGKRDEREWLDVIPVRYDSPHIQQIAVLCKKDSADNTAPTLFDGFDGFEDTFRKTRKATGCPEFAALIDNVEHSDIDLNWYSLDKKAKSSAKCIAENRNEIGLLDTQDGCLEE